MDLKNCPNCGKEIEKEAKKCVYCGCDLTKETEDNEISSTNSEKTIEDINNFDQNEKEFGNVIEPNIFSEPQENMKNTLPKENFLKKINNIWNKSKLSKIIIIVIIIALCFGFYEGFIVCHHDWKEATCTTPKTCSKCGKTEGESLSHKWQQATCTKPKTCERCGETDGNALGHKEGNWETVSVASINESGQDVKKCTICREIIDTKTTTVSLCSNGNAFNFTTDEFIEYMKDNINYDSIDRIDDVENNPCYRFSLEDKSVILMFMTDSSEKVNNIITSSTNYNTSVAFVSLIASWFTDSDTDKEILNKINNTQKYKTSYVYCILSRYEDSYMSSIRPKK